MTKATIVGNCQIKGISQCLKAMVRDFDIEVIKPADMSTRRPDDASKIFFIQNEFAPRFHKLNEIRADVDIVYFPGLYFTAFHPDFVYANHGEDRLMGPTGSGSSAIVIYAWQHGFSVKETINLFNESVFRELGYFSHWEASAAKVIDDGHRTGMDLAEELETWKKSGCFFHCPNHPKVAPLAGISRGIVKRLGLTPKVNYPENLVEDTLISSVVWPQYPEVAKQFGLQGEYIFRGKARENDPTGNALDLESYVSWCFKMWADKDPAKIQCDRLLDPKMERILRFRNTAPKPKRAANPYSNIKDHQRWSKAVAAPDPSDIDPVVDTKFKITRADKVATAGSCFAQHISRALKDAGYNYFVAEQGGVFSARYGNIYSTRQLLQLFDRSEGDFEPAEGVWQREDGQFVDPFRPQIEPLGFVDEASLEASRREHLASVSRMWRECDVLVFTLGLTETWMSKVDGAAFPLAPGVSGGRFDPHQHSFHNLTVSETVADLRAFIARLRSVNPGVRIILTVSPVPLIATAEDKHVLVSTTYSKSVLRAAAQEVSDGEPLVQYFPSYEIITGSYSRGRYFDDDLRAVTDEGVSHVMRVFMKHMSETPTSSHLSGELKSGSFIVCDEEAIEAAQ
ncbi:GSCFA domain-containing protein [Rhizobium sp. XQZ8]|uniref:GSCFA domain-containing protein n=1 Tax=Rhizobium populisoli TaxID=2859785 RepID=UPI001CA4FBC1|nr:GSCFA domain-containing protein [Rhizobium populisoli]MBW6420182.1 GSCFA domain-containing protein [Rhizobium populisoli]